jgi:hypothetical protein
MSVPMTPRDRAIAFLDSYFEAHPDGGWKKDIVAAAAALGINQRTLEVARKRMGVQSQFAGPSGAIWRLPIARGDES